MKMPSLECSLLTLAEALLANVWFFGWLCDPERLDLGKGATMEPLDLPSGRILASKRGLEDTGIAPFSSSSFS